MIPRILTIIYGFRSAREVVIIYPNICETGQINRCMESADSKQYLWLDNIVVGIWVYVRERMGISPGFMVYILLILIFNSYQYHHISNKISASCIPVFRHTSVLRLPSPSSPRHRRKAPNQKLVTHSYTDQLMTWHHLIA